MSGAISAASTAAASPKGSMVLQGFGAGMSAMGAFSQASAQQDALDYQAQVAANNAVIAGYQGQIAKQVGEVQEQNSRLKSAQVYGASRAAMAANGIDLGEGTATDILTTDKYIGERDALTIRDTTAQRVWAYKTQGQNFISESDAYGSAADAINPFMSAAGSLLTGASSVAKSYYGFKKQGML